MINALAPDFVLTGTHGEQRLSALRGSYVVLYFYPRDATPGCTLEATSFRDYQAQFADLNAVILGVSRDALATHDKFTVKQQLTFALLSDPDETVCLAYEVIKNKNMYGKPVRGIERSTFLIDPEGMIKAAWRKVNVKGHVEAVLLTIEHRCYSARAA